MKRFTVVILWRLYRWELRGMARSSAALVAGLLEYFPLDARVRVTREEDDADQSRAARDREEYARDMEPYTRPAREGDVTP